MAELKENKRKNGKLSLYPLKFDEAIRGLLTINPKEKTHSDKSQAIVTDSKSK